MINLNHTYWQNRYQQNHTNWDLGNVSTPIKEYVDQLKNKDLSILIPGAGNAHEAVYLNENGFTNFTVLDLVDIPLKQTQKRLPNLSKHQFICQNFFEHQSSYDLIIEQTFFCALEPHLRESYVEKNHELLNDEGSLVGVFFDFEETHIGPPFGGTKMEYYKLFEPYFDIVILERCYNSNGRRKGKELFIKFKKKN